MPLPVRTFVLWFVVAGELVEDVPAIRPYALAVHFRIHAGGTPASLGFRWRKGDKHFNLGFGMTLQAYTGRWHKAWHIHPYVLRKNADSEDGYVRRNQKLRPRDASPPICYCASYPIRLIRAPSWRLLNSTL